MYIVSTNEIQCVRPHWYLNENTKIVTRIQNTSREKRKLIIDAQFDPWMDLLHQFLSEWDYSAGRRAFPIPVDLPVVQVSPHFCISIGKMLTGLLSYINDLLYKFPWTSLCLYQPEAYWFTILY